MRTREKSIHTQYRWNIFNHYWVDSAEDIVGWLSTLTLYLYLIYFIHSCSDSLSYHSYPNICYKSLNTTLHRICLQNQRWRRCLLETWVCPQTGAETLVLDVCARRLTWVWPAPRVALWVGEHSLNSQLDGFHLILGLRLAPLDGVHMLGTFWRSHITLGEKQEPISKSAYVKSWDGRKPGSWCHFSFSPRNTIMAH